MYQSVIELSRLEKSPDNARRTVASGVSESLKASILAHGLMQNLVVTDGGGGQFHVVEGARRLAALKALQAEGKLPPGYAVACQVVPNDLAHERSLAANTVRLAMHPADEFEAFARLIGEGSTIQEVAGRFGVETRHVLQRLKLGRLAPELLAAYRAEALTLDCLMAFTLTDDHARQLAAWESVQGLHRVHPGTVRRILTDTLVEAESKLARFVGIDAYRAAGGTLKNDLFGEETYLENPELLQALAAEKLRLAAKEVEAEGWGWVEVSEDHDWSRITGCGRIQPQPMAIPQELLNRQSALEAEQEEIEVALEDTESDALIERHEAIRAELAEIAEGSRSRP